VIGSRSFGRRKDKIQTNLWKILSTLILGKQDEKLCKFSTFFAYFWWLIIRRIIRIRVEQELDSLVSWIWGIRDINSQTSKKIYIQKQKYTLLLSFPLFCSHILPWYLQISCLLLQPPSKISLLESSSRFLWNSIFFSAVLIFTNPLKKLRKAGMKIWITKQNFPDASSIQKQSISFFPNNSMSKTAIGDNLHWSSWVNLCNSGNLSLDVLWNTVSQP